MGKITFTCELCTKSFLEYKSNRVKKHIFCSKVCSDKNKLGHTPWNKGVGDYISGDKNPFFGKKHTQESLVKMSKIHKGKPVWNKGIKQWEGKQHPNLGMKHTKEAREKISKALLGKTPWNKAMTNDERILNKRERGKFRDTMQKLVFERDKYICQLCGSKGPLQVDHIQSWAEYVELRFSMDNCRTLCDKCHYKITFGKNMPKDIKTWGQNFKLSERMVI